MEQEKEKKGKYEKFIPFGRLDERLVFSVPPLPFDLFLAASTDAGDLRVGP